MTELFLAVVLVLVAGFLGYAVVIPVMTHYGDRVARWIEDHLP